MMITVKCYYSNGDTITTGINGSFDEAKKYFLNQVFNLGSVADNMQKCVDIKQIIKVVVKLSGEPAQAAEIECVLSSLQKFVGGYIESVDFIGNTLMICNEEGKLEGLPVNFRFGSDIIVGPVIICGVDGENFGSLSDDETEQVLKHLNS